VTTFIFKGLFTDEPLLTPVFLLLEENLWGILWAMCPSCHQTISIKTMKETQVIDRHQGKRCTGIMLSYSLSYFQEKVH